MSAMPQETLTALQASIARWQANAVAKTPYDVRLGIEACPLCALFFDGACKDCPVMAKTGRRGCAGSPYGAAEMALYMWRSAPHNHERRGAFRAAARAEVEFLESLLPEMQLRDMSADYAAASESLR